MIVGGKMLLKREEAAWNSSTVMFITSAFHKILVATDIKFVLVNVHFLSLFGPIKLSHVLFSHGSNSDHSKLRVEKFKG